jgi:lipopolysaccharide export system protein LptA
MKSLLTIAGVTLAMVVAQSAAAQPQKHSKSPFDVIADHAEIHNNDCTVIYSGSAEAIQDNSRLRANTMIAHLEMKRGKSGGGGLEGADAANACGAMTTLEAKGAVYYVAGDGRRVHGDNGLYDSASTTVTITGDVTAVDGQNVMRGTKMVYNTQTGEGHVEGGGKGPGAKNRPRGVFYPKDSNEDGASGDKPKKAAK